MKVMPLRGLRGLRSASATVLLAAVGLAVMVTAVLAALLWEERGETLSGQRQRGELFARVLEDHVTRSLESVAFSLATLAGSAEEAGVDEVVRSSAMLAQTVSAQPQLRGLAMVDRQGMVRASSSPRDVGQRIDLPRLGPTPMSGRGAIGPYVAGRGLGDLATRAAAAAAPAGVGFIPMLRSVATRDGHGLVLVALINPEALVSHMRLTLNDAESAAVLATYAGQVLVATSDLAPGSSLAALPVFKSFLPQREHASYVGAGVRAGEQVLAFRVSRSFPLVVLVERPLSIVVAEWFDKASYRLALGLLAAAVIAGLGVIAARSVRLREQARERLDQAQAEVARRERELSVIVRSVQELLFRTDRDGVLTFVNARWAAAIGDQADAALGRHLTALVRDTSRGDIERLFVPDDSGGVRTAHAVMEPEPGRVRRFDFAVVPLHHAGELIGFAGSAVDMTERHEAGERLQEQLEFSARLLEISPLPTSMLDAQGRYLSVNRAWEEFMGRRRQDVIGKSPRDHLPLGESSRHGVIDRQLLETGGSHRYEARISHRDGSRRDLLISKVVVPGREGASAGILATFLDVSELRGAERATREARDAAEEASRAKSEFIANISHELRTPLQSILGFSELGMLRGREQSKLAGMFTDIHASGQRMLALVNDLLDVSKLESSVGTFHLERTDVRPLVREVLRELDPLLGPKALRIDADISAGQLVAKVDPLRLQQVVRNVLANAIKFSPPAAVIDLLCEATAEGDIHIAVRDQGPGVPEGEIDKIFEAFVQSTKTKDGAGGTGLGLTICRKIVEAHGGRIHAENMPDGGSRFHIHLPARGFSDTVPSSDI
jgi:PAS domain S-box-containing protein